MRPFIQILPICHNINPSIKQVTIGLLRLCHIDPPPRLSAFGYAFVVRTAKLRSGFASLAPLVATCLLLWLMIADFGYFHEGIARVVSEKPEGFSLAAGEDALTGFGFPR